MANHESLSPQIKILLALRRYRAAQKCGEKGEQKKESKS
jgi:hypothetical protein